MYMSKWRIIQLVAANDLLRIALISTNINAAKLNIENLRITRNYITIIWNMTRKTKYIAVHTTCEAKVAADNVLVIVIKEKEKP